MSIRENQLQAERGQVIKDLVFELGGLAHEYMTTQQLDTVLDGMLTKQYPSNPSPELQRWIHTHRNNPAFKIHQLLGTNMAKISALVAECFGKFHDPASAECRLCRDRALCRSKTRSSNSDAETGALTQISIAYPMKAPTTDAISEVLQAKGGQIAQSLHHGGEVRLVIKNNKLRVLSVDTATKQVIDQENYTMAKAAVAANAKSKKAAEAEELDDEVEEDDTELEDEEVGDEEEVEDDEESEEDTEESEEGEEEEAEEEPAAAAPVKEKKPKKEKAPLSKSQQAFQTELDGMTDTAAKQKHSTKKAKELGLKGPFNPDARVGHMQRVMAIKKHLGEQDAKKPAAATKSTPAKTAAKGAKK